MTQSHEITGVEYVPVCDSCWKPAEQFDVQDANGQWRHGGFRHLDPALNISGAERIDRSPYGDGGTIT